MDHSHVVYTQHFLPFLPCPWLGSFLPLQFCAELSLYISGNPALNPCGRWNSTVLQTPQPQALNPTLRPRKAALCWDLLQDLGKAVALPGEGSVAGSRSQYAFELEAQLLSRPD